MITPIYQIREAKTPDKEAIVVLWSDLARLHQTLDSRFIFAPASEKKYMRHAVEMIRSRDAKVLVAESLENRAIVGYLMGELQSRSPIALPGTYGFISEVCVHPDWRRLGIGQSLFAKSCEWFVSRKAQAVQLYVAEANEDAQAFWQNLGLTPFLHLFHFDLIGKIEEG